MPLTNLTCPHCAKEIELPEAAVTRSSVCPVCGGKVLFEPSGGVSKREAALLPRESIFEPMAVALPYLPRPLSEQEINLQRRDPASRLLLVKLVGGMVSLALLIGLMVLLQSDEGSEVMAEETKISEKSEAVVEKVSVLAAKVKEDMAVVPEVEATQETGSFDTLFSERPKMPVELRVWATEGDVYGGVFGDSEWLRCVELRAADDPKGRLLRAYVVRTSDTGGAVDFRLRQGGAEPLQWTVRVKYPPEAEEPNQVWLEEVVADGWEVPAR